MSLADEYDPEPKPIAVGPVEVAVLLGVCAVVYALLAPWPWLAGGVVVALVGGVVVATGHTERVAGFVARRLLLVEPLGEQSPLRAVGAWVLLAALPTALLTDPRVWPTDELTSFVGALVLVSIGAVVLAFRARRRPADATLVVAAIGSLLVMLDRDLALLVVHAAASMLDPLSEAPVALVIVGGAWNLALLPVAHGCQLLGRVLSGAPKTRAT